MALDVHLRSGATGLIGFLDFISPRNPMYLCFRTRNQLPANLDIPAVYNPFIRICAITQKPWALPFVLTIWVFFDFFIILLTLYNAMERPHRNQAEVMTSLQHDGAKMFVVSDRPAPAPFARLNIRPLVSLSQVSIAWFGATHAHICASASPRKSDCSHRRRCMLPVEPLE